MIFPTLATIYSQEVLSMGWGLEIIFPIYAGILAGLILCRYYVGKDPS